MTAELDVIADYAERLATSERNADSSSREFLAFHALYENKDLWVEEWLRVSPEPKNPSNNWKADSKSRFTQWLQWKLEQQGHSAFIGWRHTYENLAAGEIVHRIPTLRHGAKLTERSLRPFNWMLKNHYDDRLEEVVKAAIESAGSVDAITYRHSRDAVNGWKKQWLRGRGGGRSVGAIDAAARARRIRMRILNEFQQMYTLGCKNERAQEEFNALLEDIDSFLEDHSEKGDAA